MSHLTSNLLGRCPLGRKNCPYADSYCSDCMKYEKGRTEKVEIRRRTTDSKVKGEE